MEEYTVSDQVFDELKRAAIKIWKGYDNTYGYVDEKLEIIEPLHNFKDNFGTLIGMFDGYNQITMYNLVGDDAKLAMDKWTGGVMDSYERAKSFGMID